MQASISISQNRSRQRIDLVNMVGKEIRGLRYTITLSSPGRNQVMTKLFAEAEDMDVYQVGKRVVCFVEEMLVKRGASNHLAPMQRQVFKDGVFARRERYGLAGSGDHARAGVERY